jgi:hypothetical protein
VNNDQGIVSCNAPHAPSSDLPAGNFEKDWLEED